MNVLSPHFLDGYVKYFRLAMIFLKKGTYLCIYKNYYHPIYMFSVSLYREKVEYEDVFIWQR